MTQTIGILAEKSLHAALKIHYAQPGDLIEARVGGYWIDIVRPQPEGDLLIEIQTGNFSGMRRKLAALLPDYRVHVIHPMPRERHIVRIDTDGVIKSRRKSPQKGDGLDALFRQLVSIPGLFTHPHFTLEIAWVRDEIVYCDDGQGSWRRKHWSIADRRLLGVDVCAPLSLAELRAYLPEGLCMPFTSVDLANAGNYNRPLAGKIAYCLRECGILAIVGKRGNAYLYEYM